MWGLAEMLVLNQRAAVRESRDSLLRRKTRLLTKVARLERLVEDLEPFLDGRSRIFPTKAVQEAEAKS